METIRQDLNKAVLGATITGLTSNWSKKVKPSLQGVQQRVVGKKIMGIDRQAKLLSIDLSGGEHLLIHLKMTGQLLLRNQEDKADKYVHHIIQLGHRELRFADVRKFGYLQVVNSAEKEKIFASFGLDVLVSRADISVFCKILQKKVVPIKTALMEQTLIAGVGNIYANEALFLAGINPLRKSKTLSEVEVTKLLSCLKKVFKQGLKYRGVSDSTYVDLYGKQGQFQNHLKVYRKRGAPCPHCGAKIMYQKLNGRGTYYCQFCQK